MSRKTTIKDIAKAVGVTPATVSNVLNGTKKKYSEETKQRILLAAEQLNYTPNLSARALVKRRTYNIGLFIPASPSAFSDPYFSELLRGLSEVTLEHGYIVSIIYSDGLDENIRARIDGLVLTEVRLKDEYIKYFRSLGVPFVVLANGDHNGVKDYVVSDTKNGMEEAIEHLYKLGHRHLGYALGPISYNYVYERYMLFKQILKEMGLGFHSSYVGRGENSKDGGEHAIKEIMRSRKKPTAIFASTDIMALGVIEYLKSVGCKVPDEISVVGFDDAAFSRYVSPTITTVSHDIYQLGRHAAAMLISKLEGKEYQKPVTLPVKFIIRESISPFKRYNQINY